ncbi:MAG: hypothetical protein MH208_16455, partial [Marinobacter sp.]|nr:hypothetical protein [Marinobacter sp.]
LTPKQIAADQQRQVVRHAALCENSTSVLFSQRQKVVLTYLPVALSSASAWVFNLKDVQPV